jgi:alkyl sulfatase BDS1-like metallo-beta-lactamase superfamily hydrolase
VNRYLGHWDGNPANLIPLSPYESAPLLMGVKSMDDMIADGTAKTKGDESVIEKLKSTLIHFEMRFEILPGTVPVGDQQLNRNPFQQDMPAVIGAE